VRVTFAIVETEEPLLAELLSLAFGSAGHDCLVLNELDQVTRVLDALHLDSIVIVMDLHVSGRSGLEWLETAVTTWPDLSARTLLITRTAVTEDEAARISALGVEVAPTPRSVVEVERVVIGRVRKARSERAHAEVLH
jgi:DNA-binding response OmpR family regulator